MSGSWSGFSNTDYYSRSASFLSWNNTEYTVRIKGKANRGAGGQVLAAVGFIQPLYLQLAANGNYVLAYRNNADSTETDVLASLADGEDFDLATHIRSTADEIELEDLGGGGHSTTISPAGGVRDSPSILSNIYIGRYASAAFAATDALIRYVEFLGNGTSQVRYDASISELEDQVGSNDLNKTGSPIYIPPSTVNAQLLDPSALKPGLTTNGGVDLKPSLVTESYSGGTPSSPEEVKPGLRTGESLKPSLLDSEGNLKPSFLK